VVAACRLQCRSVPTLMLCLAEPPVCMTHKHEHHGLCNSVCLSIRVLPRRHVYLFLSHASGSSLSCFATRVTTTRDSAAGIQIPVPGEAPTPAGAMSEWVDANSPKTETDTKPGPKKRPKKWSPFCYHSYTRHHFRAQQVGHFSGPEKGQNFSCRRCFWRDRRGHGLLAVAQFLVYPLPRAQTSGQD